MLKTNLLIDLSTSIIQIMVKYDWVDDGSSSNSDSNRKCLSDTPKSIYLLTSYILILRMSSLIDLSTSATHIVVEYDKVDEVVVVVVILIRRRAYQETSATKIEVNYNGVNNDAISLIFKTSSSIDLSTSTAQTMGEFDEFGASDSANSKLVKKLSKSQKIIKSPKNFKSLKKS